MYTLQPAWPLNHVPKHVGTLTLDTHDDVAFDDKTPFPGVSKGAEVGRLSWIVPEGSGCPCIRGGRGASVGTQIDLSQFLLLSLFRIPLCPIWEETCVSRFRSFNPGTVVGGVAVVRLLGHLRWLRIHLCPARGPSLTLSHPRP